MRNKWAYLFLLFGLCSLLLGLFFGLLAAGQYLFPGFLKGFMDFSKSRPLHVTPVVAWIVTTSAGVVYYRMSKTEAWIPGTARWHFFSFLIGGVLIIVSLLSGLFGGREYMAYPPVLSAFILLGWILFAIGFFVHFVKQVKQWPVYIWMWASGIVFFIFTFTEAHLWLLPYFRNNMIRDIAVQWKSYGALVGSWNMLVYGTGIYIMHSIQKEHKLIRGKLAFSLYFTGLINLMFGWAHHCYILPYSPWIRLIAYAISMSELLILGRMIYLWSKSLLNSVKHLHLWAYRFLFSADYWIVFNLLLAVLISIPFVNYYTHGTHITVAHAMGTTIGINTTILIAAIIWIVQKEDRGFAGRFQKQLKFGFFMFHASLVVFWVCLIFSGILKSVWMYQSDPVSFGEMMSDMHPVFFVLYLSGVGIVTGLSFIIFPAFKSLVKLIGKQ